MQSKLLIIIPAYNEAENIERVVDNLIENYPQYDYIIVNDGSKDKTLEICEKNGYHYIDMPINTGLTCGVQTGMMYAYQNKYEYAVQFDGDGQHDPEFLDDMVEAMAECDICIGSRFETEKKPFTARMIGSRVIAAFLRLTTGKKITDPTSGMRMFNRATMRAMAKQPDYGPEPDTLAHLIRSGAVVKSVQVTMHERIAGESYLNFTRSMKYVLRMCMSMLIIQWFRKKVSLKGGIKACQNSSQM